VPVEQVAAAARALGCDEVLALDTVEEACAWAVRHTDGDDAVERGLIGQIVARFEAKGLTIVALDLRTLDEELLAEHYAEHVGKGFYGELVAFMSRGPVVALVVEGPENTWEVVRAMMGATNPRLAAPGTIRGDLGILVTENLVHGSDSAESAAREIKLFFPHL
jgi:nucleoside-diphosphate kinase